MELGSVSSEACSLPTALPAWTYMRCLPKHWDSTVVNETCAGSQVLPAACPTATVVLLSQKPVRLLLPQFPHIFPADSSSK